MYDRKTKAVIDRREMLRVKIKSLAEEAKIIRKEEQRTWGGLRDELHVHRVREVRNEARAAHLAYGFIRGRTLDQMEVRALSAPDWEKIKYLCKRYGPVGFIIPTATLAKAA